MAAVRSAGPSSWLGVTEFVLGFVTSFVSYVTLNRSDNRSETEFPHL